MTAHLELIAPARAPLSEKEQRHVSSRNPPTLGTLQTTASFNTTFQRVSMTRPSA